jgi:LysM repeat protein
MFVRLLTTILLALAVWGASAHGSGASERGHVYVVRPGDTLWSIAADHYGGDTREGVWEIERRNGLDVSGTITVGESLRLPW